MGNYEQLKEAIKAVIKTNGKQEITGQVMQDTLLAITSSFGQGALFAGIATPETNPLTPDQNVFYLAGIDGVYSNFGNIELKNEVSILVIENNQWVKKETNIANNKNISDLEKDIKGTNLQTSVSFDGQYQQKALPFTIPEGSTITLIGDVSQITCRTNSGDSDYQTVVSGTIADRDINFVKSGTETGNVTIKAEKLSLDKQVEKNTNAIIVLNNFEITKRGISNFKMNIVKNRDYKPLKILGIGNSWTLNATTYLGEMLNGLGVNVEIGVSFAGGATLQSYWNNIKNNIPAYEFHRFVNGAWSSPKDKITYKDIVSADNWDIITHQQQSGNGGVYSSFQPYLNDIIEYEKKYMSLYPVFFMHATWAYPNGYVNEQFEEYYQSNTETMYNAILAAYNQAMIDENIINVMPSAPMIQQVRTLGIPDIDTADGGSHLSTNGQFAVACVWAETILRKYFNQEVVSGISIENSQYKPAALSEENAVAIRTLAKTIVENVKIYFPQQQ